MILNNGFYIVEINNDSGSDDNYPEERVIAFSDSEEEIIKECENLNAKLNLPSKELIGKIINYLFKCNVENWRNPNNIQNWVKENPADKDIEKYIVIHSNRLDKNFQCLTYEVRSLNQ